MTIERETLELLPAPLDLLPAPAPPPRNTTIVRGTLSRLEVNGEVTIVRGTLSRLEVNGEVLGACPIGNIDDCMRHRSAELGPDRAGFLARAIETQMAAYRAELAALRDRALAAAPTAAAEEPAPAPQNRVERRAQKHGKRAHHGLLDWRDHEPR